MRKLLLIPVVIALPLAWGAIAFVYIKIRHHGVPAGESMPDTPVDYAMAGLGLTVSVLILPLLLLFWAGCHAANIMAEKRSTTPP